MQNVNNPKNENTIKCQTNHIQRRKSGMISQKTRQRVENGGAGGQVGCGAPATSVSIDNWAFPMLRMMRMGMNMMIINSS